MMMTDLSNIALDAIRTDERFIRRAEEAIDRELEEERQPVDYHGKRIDTHQRAESLRRQ